ncbi:hypothetical protein [Streptomyces sp. NPDC020362]|uniref:hypothetical protein n=1 Tax=unclassified Streptomyces TaxID=2593676 RepID=UPI000B05CC5A
MVAPPGRRYVNSFPAAARTTAAADGDTVFPSAPTRRVCAGLRVLHPLAGAERATGAAFAGVAT